MVQAFTYLGVLVVAVPLVIGIGLLGAIWRSWWLYPTWGWFIVPLGVRAVSFWHFTAMLTLIGILTTHTDTKQDDRKQSWVATATLFIWPPIVWFMLRWMREAQ